MAMRKNNTASVLTAYCDSGAGSAPHLPKDQYDAILIVLFEKHRKKIEILSKKIKKINDDQEIKVDLLKKDLEKQKDRTIEIVGLFSAIIALVIIDASVIKSAETFLAAILLITSLTCSMAIFAILIHSFFAQENKIKEKYILVPIVLLSVLISIGIITYFFKMDLYQMNNEDKRTVQNKENLENDYVKD